jgi:hypothetical protein
MPRNEKEQRPSKTDFTLDKLMCKLESLALLLSFVHVDSFVLRNRHEEESMFGKSASEFPFLLEDKLIVRAAKYKKGEVMLPFLIVDDNLITGQNPYSTTLVAE